MNMIMGRYRQRFTKHTFSETMGVHYSYMEMFTSWAVSTKETQVRGRDHHGQFRIGHGWSAMAGETKLICNTLRVQWIRLQGYEIAKGIYRAVSRVASVSDFVATVESKVFYTF